MPDRTRLDHKAKVAIFISGSGTNMAALLYASRLDKAGYEVVLVASNNPQAEGLRLAEAEGVTTFAHSHKGISREDHDAVMEAAVRKAGAQYIVLAGYMRILSDGFVERWRGAMLNIHPSLLPKYKGLDTHARAIEAGDSHGGASVHLVTAELDAGEVLGQVKVTIRADDTADSLAERVKLAEHQLYPQVVAAYVSRGSDPEYLLEQVRGRALQLPEVEERASHGAPGWKASGKSGKYFAYFSDHHHGEDAIALLVKTSGTDEQSALIDSDPSRFYRPAFYGASGWIALVLDRPGLDWDQVDYWLSRSWRSIAPKRFTNLQDAADMF